LVERIVLGRRFLERGYFEPASIRRLWENHLNPKPWRLDLGGHLWALLVLELWHRIYLDGESIEDVREELLEEMGVDAEGQRAKRLAPSGKLKAESNPQSTMRSGASGQRAKRKAGQQTTDH
jgi:hypothetical protein